MRRVRRSVVTGFSASWGSAGAPESSLEKKLMPLTYTWIVDVLNLRTVWVYVMRLVVVKLCR